MLLIVSCQNDLCIWTEIYFENARELYLINGKNGFLYGVGINVIFQLRRDVTA